MPSDLETLREIFKDKRAWIGVGTVKQKEIAKDGSVMRVKLNLLPDNHEIIARMTWDGTGPETGAFNPVSIGDLVMVAYSDGTEDTAYVIRRLTSRADKMHPKAKDDHTVVQSLDNKQLYLGSKTKVNVGSGRDCNEQMTLGTTNLNFMLDFFDLWLNATYTGVCAVGETFLSEQMRLGMEQLRAYYLADANTNIVSQIAYTERKAT